MSDLREFRDAWNDYLTARATVPRIKAKGPSEPADWAGLNDAIQRIIQFAPGAANELQAADFDGSPLLQLAAACQRRGFSGAENRQTRRQVDAVISQAEALDHE